MSVLPVAHVTLCGLAADRERLLSELQDLGVAHLIHEREDSTDTAAVTHPPPSRLRRALRFLEAARHRWHQSHDRVAFDAAAIVAEAFETEARMRVLEEERDGLLRRIRDLAPWGEFEFPDDGPAELRLWFYVIPHHRLRAIGERDDLCWAVVHRDEHHSHVVVIAGEEPAGMPVERTHAGARGLAAVRERLETVLIEFDELESRRSRASRWCDLLAASLDRLQDEGAVREALRRLRVEPPFFVLQAWVPCAALDEIRSFAETRSLAWASRPPAEGEQPPTLLENHGVSAFGQDLLRFYLVPGYGGWDPSASIFWFFAVFFAVILSDAGYAALLAVTLVAAWRRLGRTQVGQRARRFGFVVVLASIGWGVAIGSYFGVAPSPGGVLGHLAFVDVRDPLASVAVAVLLGTAQIAWANLATAAHFGGRVAWARIGWLGVLAGAVWLWQSPATGGAYLAHPAVWLAVAGALAVAVFSGTSRSLPRRAVDGALALTRVVGLFSDVLSYLRIFALAFAGAALAGAFNTLAGRAAEAAPGIGVLLALLILMAGHTANLVIGVASGIVHGLRLNLIEYLNWSVTDEGVPFQPFDRKEKRAWRNH